MYDVDAFSHEKLKQAFLDADGIVLNTIKITEHHLTDTKIRDNKKEAIVAEGLATIGVVKSVIGFAVDKNQANDPTTMLTLLGALHKYHTSVGKDFQAEINKLNDHGIIARFKEIGRTIEVWEQAYGK